MLSMAEAQRRGDIYEAARKKSICGKRCDSMGHQIYSLLKGYARNFYEQHADLLEISNPRPRHPGELSCSPTAQVELANIRPTLATPLLGTSRKHVCHINSKQVARNFFIYGIILSSDYCNYHHCVRYVRTNPYSNVYKVATREGRCSSLPKDVRNRAFHFRMPERTSALNRLLTDSSPLPLPETWMNKKSKSRNS